MNENNVVTGSVVGTGALVNVVVGFKPSKIEIFNETDLSHYVWTASMAAGKGVKTITAGTVSFMAANGLSQYSGVAGSVSEGFSIGTDVNMNVAADVIHYVATR